tara:strand:- start:5988 stop:6110 length:123 start_codon:yes stop_codon:yes gene_type:complete
MDDLMRKLGINAHQACYKFINLGGFHTVKIDGTLESEEKK